MTTERRSDTDPALVAQGRLTVRPGSSRGVMGFKPGLHRLGVGNPRDGSIYVPHSYDARLPAPLLVMLHGAGGTAEQVLPMVQEAAETHAVVVLAPDSRNRGTWDVIRGGYGPDVTFLDRAFAALFELVDVRSDRIAIGGFSDGASYALSLGLINGAFFRSVLAFSPGFAAPTMTAGHPRVFISHGTHDEVLPIDRCGRHLARALSEAGYDLDVHEFAGGHVVPPEMVEAGFRHFLAV